jgi:hypothetical protein
MDNPQTPPHTGNTGVCPPAPKKRATRDLNKIFNNLSNDDLNILNDIKNMKI